MKKEKGYTKLYRKNKILGLEFFDFLLLLVAYLIVFLLSKNLLVNLAILITVYLILGAYKKAKPPHWTESIARFLFTPKHFPEKKEGEKEVFKK